jgi:hypothetical protein
MRFSVTKNAWVEINVMTATVWPPDLLKIWYLDIPKITVDVKIVVRCSVGVNWWVFKKEFDFGLGIGFK